MNMILYKIANPEKLHVLLIRFCMTISRRYAISFTHVFIFMTSSRQYHHFLA